MKRRDALTTLLALGAGACNSLPVARTAPTVSEEPANANFIAAVPFIATRPEIVDAMLALASIQANDVIYDLGCGDGRIVIAAAKERGASGLGVDIQPDVIDQANAQAQYAGVDGRVKFRVSGDGKSDGTPDRTSHSWLVKGKPGDVVTVSVEHQRAGSGSVTVVLK